VPVEVILPKVDMDMTTGTIAHWHVAEGDSVQKGAALFDIETDKAAMEVEAPASGRLAGIAAQPGDRVAVGTVVALIYGEGESLPDRAPAGPAAAPAPQPDGAVEVILPKVDMDMTHGTLAAWHVAEGETVTKGAPLFDIETEKAAMEIEAPASGTLRQVAARPGDRLAVGSVVAWIQPAGAAAAPRPQDTAGLSAPLRQPRPAATPATPAPVQAAEGPADPEARRRATPAARAAARAAGIALAAVGGSGPNGRIQRDDVIATALRPQEAPRPADRPATWTAQAGRLHVSDRNGTGVPLVLLHGFAADSQSWAPLEKALGGQLRLIRIDLPGHGRSPRRKLGGFAELARAMVEAFDDARAGLDRVDLLGHSLGGALALAIADVRPRHVRSVALIAPAGFGPEIDAVALGGITRATRADSLAPWLRRLTAVPEGISDDYARAAMRLRTDPDLRACQADMAEVLFPDGVQPFDLRPAFSRLTCPTSVIWGRQDHILPWRQALSAPGDFALHLLSGAGHVPQIECPERVARILSRHLAAAAQEN